MKFSCTSNWSPNFADIWSCTPQQNVIVCQLCWCFMMHFTPKLYVDYRECCCRVKNLMNSMKIFSILIFSLPAWAQLIWPSQSNLLEYFAALFLKAFSHNSELKKISAGFFLKLMFDRFKSQPEQKLWLYSAQDVTIATLLNTLNVYKVNSSFFQQIKSVLLRNFP